MQLITYDERWSELELGLQRLKECPQISFRDDKAKFMGDSIINPSNNDSEIPIENGKLTPTEDIVNGTSSLAQP